MIGGGYSTGSTGYNLGGNDPLGGPNETPNSPDLNPEAYDPTVWENFWTYRGKGNTKYGVPKETFYLAYQKSDFNQMQYDHTVKLYRVTSGQISHEQTVSLFEIQGMYGKNTVKQKSIEKAKLWFVNRYANYHYDMGELEWDESIKWAESYVNNVGNGNANMWIITGVAALGLVAFAFPF